MDDLRKRFGDPLALAVCQELDLLDIETGLAAWPGWQPMTFDPDMPPVAPMDWINA